MKKLLLSCLALQCVFLAGPWAAEEKGAAEEAKAPTPPPEAEQSVTEHSIRMGGTTLAYTATAGTLILRDEKDEPIARFGYVAYTKQGVKDASRRPITFAYNGGPGSSSIWLHMGTLGPRRILTADAESTPPPPYDVVDNEFSIIDVTDLVMIDPVGTGLSRPVGKAKNEDFWGVDKDIKSVSQFIYQYVNDNERWNSPKYLLGESYGTMRSAGVVDYLQTRNGMAFNGVILVSVFVDAATAITIPGNDEAYRLFVPTYAAVAWYQKALKDRPDDLGAFLGEVRAFCAGEYMFALQKGDRLQGEERAAVVAKLSRYTGLSADYWDKANLRVSEGQFTKELLRQHGKTVGRLDSRFTGVSFNLLGEEANYDPQSAAISPAFTAAFMNYLHHDLEFGQGKTYNVSARGLFRTWEFKHQMPGVRFPVPGLPNTGVDLAHAMGYNPNLEVLVLNGYFDLATPFFATEYTMDHLGLAPELQDHVHMKYYQAGHMMYLHPPSLKQFKADVAAFIRSTDRL
ncbi:MAG: S10 family peptidase [Acidobacteriota bacterium]